MRRGMVWIGHETLASLIRLHDSEYVHAVFADWRRMAVGVCVAGPDLPDVPEGQEAPDVDPSGYVDLNLRAKLTALVDRWRDERDGKDAADVIGMLTAVLAGTFDPRLELHGPDLDWHEVPQ